MEAGDALAEVETVRCPDCNRSMKIEVLRSNAGNYIGTACSHCGPYDRYSGYYEDCDVAACALKNKTYYR